MSWPAILRSVFNLTGKQNRLCYLAHGFAQSHALALDQPKGIFFRQFSRSHEITFRPLHRFANGEGLLHFK